MRQADVMRHAGLGKPGRGALAAALAVFAALTLPACGGESDAAASIPQDCLEAWNAETPSLTFGRHVYNEHDSTRAHIRLAEPSKGAINIKGAETCAVVFAVEESDPEYGDVGLTITKFGWASLKELARGDSVKLDQIQREANTGANATLFPDGTLDPN